MNSYTIRYQVLEESSPIPLLSKEAAVNGDTALKLYSQVLHETVGAGIIPKTLSEIFQTPSSVAPEQEDDDTEGYGELAEAVQHVRQEECQAATTNESVPLAGFVCDSCGSAITEEQAENSYIVSGKELCSSCFHQHCLAVGLREPESVPADKQPAPVVEQNLTVDSRGKVLRKWTPGEKGILRRFATVNDALEGFHKEYSETCRTDKSIAGAWYVLKDKGLLMSQTSATDKKAASEEENESSESASSHTFRLNDYVKVTDKTLPCYGEAGKIISIRKDEALIGFAKSRYWIAIGKLQLQESPSKN